MYKDYYCKFANFMPKITFSVERAWTVHQPNGGDCGGPRGQIVMMELQAKVQGEFKYKKCCNNVKHKIHI